MRPRLAQREVALAGLALLAVAVSLAVTAQTRTTSSKTPQPEGSSVALAGSSGPEAFGRRTACGGVIRPDTVGVSHPTLPCGARGPFVPGRQFDLTDALARRLGLRGVQEIHWAYARSA
jgi:rare lipoprotein A (peptidoglycan hydrolase)